MGRPGDVIRLGGVNHPQSPVAYKLETANSAAPPPDPQSMLAAALGTSPMQQLPGMSNIPGMEWCSPSLLPMQEGMMGGLAGVLGPGMDHLMPINMQALPSP